MRWNAYCLVYSKNLLTFAEQTRKWSLGRVARHRSAKPFTAVRIRQRPQGKSRNPSIRGLWDFFLRAFLHKLKCKVDLLVKKCNLLHFVSENCLPL